MDFLRGIEIENPYGEQAYSDDEDSEDDKNGDDDERSTGEKLLVALTRAHKSGTVDLAVVRAIICRAKAGHIPDWAPHLVGN